jgi:PAS domain S-box-containing protein
VAPRQIAAVALVLGLAVVGFFGARSLGDREARRDTERRAAVAAAQIRGRVQQASDLTESLRLSMVSVGGGGVTNAQFASNSSSWLSPAGFPAAAWVQQVPASRRAAYERGTGHRIVTQDQRGGITPDGSRPSYLPATLVSGITPMTVPGIDLGSEPGVPAALTRASKLYGAGATPLAARRDGTKGLFLIRFAPRLTRGVVVPGFVVVFVSELALRAAAAGTPGLQLTVGPTSGGAHLATAAERRTFTEAGQLFSVVVPLAPVSGTAAVLPWIILAAGLALAALARAIGVHAARRATAQDELDRIFTLSPDLIAVSDFDGHFTRINPAVEQVLGYTQEEFLARPYLDFVHPDDRERTAAQAAALSAGKGTPSFENRVIGKDGSPRVLEWTSTPVVEDRLMYGVARDVTARRQTEAELKRLAEQQAALRRVATLVATEPSPAEVFAKIVEEVAHVLEDVDVALLRAERDETATVVAIRGANMSATLPVGTRIPVNDEGVAARAMREGRSVRADDYSQVTGAIAERGHSQGMSSGLGVPVVVRSRIWGLIGVARFDGEPLPPETDTRLTQFGELVATTIANAEARVEVKRLADEQAALRRVATLVAGEAPAEEVFAKVAEEVGVLLQADAASVWCYDSDGHATVVGSWGALGDTIPAGRMKLDGDSVTALVYRTHRPARFDAYEHSTGPVAAYAREVGLRSAVGTPIVVGGRLWGSIGVATMRPEPIPVDAESRMAEFTELVATAISNVQARSDLAASRARIVATADEERRRVVRDLHDGAQQRLVHTIVTLKLARRALDRNRDDAAALVNEGLKHAETATDELRELAHGILPSILTHGGLRAGVRGLASRMAIPVETDIVVDRLPPAVEATAYFIVAEGLTNVAKHSRADRATVRAGIEGRMLQVEVRDNGVGGAQADGTGLLGLKDRLAVLDGTLRVESPVGGGTVITASIPVH